MAAWQVKDTVVGKGQCPILTTAIMHGAGGVKRPPEDGHLKRARRPCCQYLLTF